MRLIDADRLKNNIVIKSDEFGLTKTLKQWIDNQPTVKICNDVISREEVLHTCTDGWNKDYLEIMEDIKKLPSVRLETEWIPINQDIPKYKQKILVTTTDGEIALGTCINDYGEVHIGNKTLFCPTFALKNGYVAWQEAPKPYKNEEE